MPHDAAPAIPAPTAAVPPAPRRLLGTRDVASLVVGIVIGAGMFSVPAVVAANSAGPAAMMLAWLAGGALSIAGALCYAELATAHPHPGGEYHFLRLAWGPRLAFLFAWARLTVIPTGSIALLAFIFGDYASQVVARGAMSAAVLAALAVVALTGVNAIGLRSGKRTQNLLTALQTAGVVAIILAGLLLDPSTAPAETTTTTTTTTQHWGLVLIFVMLAYGGWNEAAYVSAEVVAERRTLPRALIGSIAAITLLYLLMNLAYLRVLGVEAMAGSDAVAADMMRRVLGERGAQAISAVVAVAALTSANATMLMSARTGYAFGRDTPMFALLGRWHATLHGPVNALLVQSAIALALVGLGAWTRRGFETMVEYTAPVFWLFFLLTGLALFRLRRRAPAVASPFRVPLYPLTPLLFCAMCAYLLYASLRHTGIGALLGVAVLAVGGVVLQLGGRRAVPPSAADIHSDPMPPNPGDRP